MTDLHTDGLRVCVAGIGVSGAAAARALLARGAQVLVVDAATTDAATAAGAELRAAGAEVRLGVAYPTVDVDLVVTSPGWRPSHPTLVEAAGRGIEVIGEPELAWRLAGDRPPALLGVTGTNGKTTTVGMLAAIETAAGHRATAAGNVGVPLVDAVLAEPAYDVVAVEMSSFQLHWSSTIAFSVATLLNIAADHLDWHGSARGYAEAKTRIFRGASVAVVNLDDPGVRAPVHVDRVVGFTLHDPAPGAWGVRDGVLVDETGAAVLPATALRVRGQHNIANALAAAAVARAHGAPLDAIRSGLSGYEAGPHRNAVVSVVDGVTYVDDSKATNPHAAAASLSAYEDVVWVAGGLLKGASVDDLVVEHHARLRAAVLIGADRARIRDALVRHAPDVPVVEVDASDTEAMTAVLAAARRVAAPGSTVLLAPAAASMDMFRDYAERGDAFAGAVHALARESG